MTENSSEESRDQKPDNSPPPPPIAVNWGGSSAPEPEPEKIQPPPAPAEAPAPVKASERKDRVYSWSSDFTKEQELKRPEQAAPVGTAAAGPPTPASMVNSGPISGDCKRHPGTGVEWQCERCRNCFCEPCIAGANLGGVPDGLCPECGGLCRPLEGSGKKGTKASGRITSQSSAGTISSLGREFLPMLMDSFVYPLRGKGIILLIGFPIFIVLFAVAMRISGFFGWAFLFVGSAYVSAFLMEIIETSARGSSELPNWPDVTDFADGLVIPFGKFAGTILISFAPLISYILYGYFKVKRIIEEMQMTGIMPADGIWVPSKGLIYFLLFLGYVYWPMSVITASLGYPYVFNPAKIFQSIFKVVFHYIAAFVFLFCAGWMILKGQEYIIAGLINSLGLLAGLYLGSALSAVILFYLLTIEMRVLGLIYYANEDELDF